MKMRNSRNIIVLGPHEKELINKYLQFYESLDQGTRIADTDAQMDFIAVCRKEKKPTTEHEIAYSKYIGIYTSETETETAITHEKLLAIQDSLNDNQIRPQHNSKEELKKHNNKNRKECSKKNVNKKDIKIGIVEAIQEPIDERQILLNDAIKRSMNYDSSISALVNSNRSPIPDYEEGYPRPGWFTDEDWKKMRSQDYAAMKKNHKD